MRSAILVLFLPALSALVIGCGQAGYYVASSGKVLPGTAPAEGLRVSAAHDLACDANALHPRRLHTGTVGGGRLFRESSYLDVVDGCGRRAVYKEECERDAVPSESPDEHARRQRWTLAEDKVDVCRHVLLSTVAIPVIAPR